MESDKSNQKGGSFSPLLNRFLGQAAELAREAAQSPIGERVKKQMTQLVVEKGPQVSKIVKSYASEMGNPQSLGMGLEVVKRDESGIEVTLPHRWRNRGLRGDVSTSALLTLAEFTAESYWTELLALSVPGPTIKIKLQEVGARFFDESYRQVRAVMTVESTVREQVVEDLIANGTVQAKSTVEIFQRGDKKVAEFTLQWNMHLKEQADQHTDSKETAN